METNPCNLFNLNLFLYLFTYSFLYRLLLTTKRININTALLNFNVNELRNYLKYFGRENVTWILMNAKGFFPLRVKTDLHILLRPDRLMVLILPLIQSKLIFFSCSLCMSKQLSPFYGFENFCTTSKEMRFFQPLTTQWHNYIPMSYNLKNLKVLECSRTPGNIQIHCNKNRRILQKKNILYRIHVSTAINSRITL